MKINELFQLDVDKPKLGRIDSPEEIKKPAGAHVFIINDDVTPYEVVIEAVQHGAGLPNSRARQIVRIAQRDDEALVKTYSSKDMADTVASRIEQHAQTNDRYDEYRAPYHTGWSGPWPLRCEVRDVDDGK